MRPLFYDFPQDMKAWTVDSQFMFGPRFLVAPILEYQSRNRSVYFPTSATTTTWTHYFTNQTFAAGTTTVVEAPLDHFPLFVR